MNMVEHLFLKEASLGPAVEWTPGSAGWWFVRLSGGAAYWLSRALSKELATGEMLIIGPRVAGSIRASQLGEARLHVFRFQPELLGGFFTLWERHQLESVIARQAPAVRFVPPAHPLAQQFGRLAAMPAPRQGLWQRCEALELAVNVFTEDLNHVPAKLTRRSPGLERFRQLIQRMPDQELLHQTPEHLARSCGCSVRHFSRMFSRHFGISMRAKQTELRLAKARQLLADADAKIINVALESGYRSLSLFNTMFKKAMGATPSEWRRAQLQRARTTAKVPPLSARAGAALLLALALGTGALAAAETNAPPAAPEPRFEVKAYDLEIRGARLLPDSLLEQTLTNYIGPKVSFETIRKGLAALQMLYRDRGFVTVSVSLPQQQLTNGTVKVIVNQGRLAEVTVVNNRHFSSNNVLRALPSARPGVLLNGLVLEQELNRANANRDRQIYPVLGPGPEPGTSALTLKVKDRFPLHGRLELNNYSPPNTPQLRLNLAAQYNNLWQLDHQLGLQYTLTPQTLKAGAADFWEQPLIASFSAFYRLPLAPLNGPPRGRDYQASDFGYDEITRRFRPPPPREAAELLVYASRSYADTDTQLAAETVTPPTLPPDGGLQVRDQLFNQTLTKNEDLGVRYSWPLRLFGQVASTLAVGPDLKLFWQETTQDRAFRASFFHPEIFGQPGPPFVEVPSPPTYSSRTLSHSLDYLPLSVNWEVALPDRTGTTILNLNNSFNWNAVLGGADEFRAIAGSQAANGNYYVGNFGVTRDQRLYKDWGLRLKAEGQWANQPLISNEQFGLGGNSGPRGYRDGQTYGDTGWRVLGDVRGPLWNLGMVEHTWPLTVRGLVFVDYGEAYLLDPGERQGRIPLWSTGLGVQGNISEHFDFRLLAGVPLRAVPGNAAGGVRLSFALGLQF